MAENTVTAGGRKIHVRPLTRKEVKALRRDKQIDLQALTTWKAEEAQDEVIALAISEDDIDYLDDCGNAESLKVFRKILALTYGREDEEKNSSRSGNGTQTAIE